MRRRVDGVHGVGGARIIAHRADYARRRYAIGNVPEFKCAAAYVLSVAMSGATGSKTAGLNGGRTGANCVATGQTGSNGAIAATSDAIAVLNGTVNASNGTPAAMSFRSNGGKTGAMCRVTGAFSAMGALSVATGDLNNAETAAPGKRFSATAASNSKRAAIHPASSALSAAIDRRHNAKRVSAASSAAATIVHLRQPNADNNPMSTATL